jgi:hypothetical protein
MSLLAIEASARADSDRIGWLENKTGPGQRWSVNEFGIPQRATANASVDPGIYYATLREAIDAARVAEALKR